MAENMNGPAQAVKAFGRLFFQYRGSTAIVLSLTFVGMLTDALGLLILLPLLGTLTGSEAETGVGHAVRVVLEHFGLNPTLPLVLGFFLALMGVRALVRVTKDWATAGLCSAIGDELRSDGFSALMAADWRWLTSSKRNNLANALLTEIRRVYAGVHSAVALLATVAALTAYIAVAFVAEPLVTGILSIASAVLLMLASGQHRRAMRLGGEQIAVNRKLQESVFESLSYVKLVKMLGVESSHVYKFTKATEDLRNNQLRFTVLSGASREFFQFSGALLVAVYVYVGITFWNTPVSQLLVLVFIFARAAPMLTSVQQLMHVLLNSLPSLVEVNSLISRAKAAAEPAQPEDAPALAFESVLELRNISVHFPEAADPTLVDVSLKLPAGSTTVIMGPSGAGKSTLADVLIGLLVPNEGEIILDGKLLSAGERVGLRKIVGYVPQDVVIWNGTVRENLTNGYWKATDEEIISALHAASAQFVFSLNQGIDALLGDGANSLSGGERQRIALARGLLRNPAVLVLDEVTSALDTANENRIRATISALAGKVTTVIIGHKGTFHDIADQVIEIENGRLRMVTMNR